MKNRSQDGNILFIILIAVALFAALSYAVTQSTRSSGGDTSKEKLQMTYSRMEAYVSGLRGAITRMRASGTDVLDINFHPPSDFATLTALQKASNVFHPNGGGYTYDGFQDITAAFAAPKTAVIFTDQIENIGTTTPDWTGNDIILVVVVPDDLCQAINAKMGYTSSIPSGGSFVDDGMNGHYSLNEEGSGVYGHFVADYGFPAAFAGKPEGCAIDAPSGQNYYYAVLAER